MDQVLSSDDSDAKERVYKLIQGFLLNEAAKKDSERVVKMEKGEVEGEVYSLRGCLLDSHNSTP
jgi:hypothetical protein